MARKDLDFTKLNDRQLSRLIATANAEERERLNRRHVAVVRKHGACLVSHAECLKMLATNSTTRKA